MRLLPPMRFRFHEDDREKYGGGWTVYDEAALMRTPTRELIEIERTVGPVVAVLRRARENYTDASLAAMWVARRLAGDATPFDEFSPLVWLVEWDAVEAVDVDPPAQTSSPSPSGE